MQVPFVDLKQQYASIKREINLAIEEVLDSTNFILGENVKRFENEFAAFCGAKYGIGVASGSDALALSLEALGIKNGDEIISVPNTFISTIDAISRNNATPVFVDVFEETYNIDPSRIKEKINKKTKAIIPVHLFGQPADMDPIMELANSYGLTVIEDACQAHGAHYKKQKIGSIGDLACFSFYPSKNLGAYGDGGMIVTSNDELAEKLRMMRNYGQKKKYRHSFIGHNSRLDEIQAAILRVKLKYLDGWNELRRKHANLYNELLSDLSEVKTPIEEEYVKHVYYVYVIRSEMRESLQLWLSSKGVSTLIHYPIPVHLLDAYKYLGHKNGSFPVVERCANEILSLPMFPELSDNEIEYVCEKIKEFYSKR